MTSSGLERRRRDASNILATQIENASKRKVAMAVKESNKK